MRLLMLPVGSHGDVHPYIALAQALTSRGHHATIITNEYFRPVVEGAGVEFLPIGDAHDLAKAAQTPGAMSAFLGSIRLMRGLVLPAIPDAARQFDQMVRTLKPDAVLLHPLSFGASIACEKHAIPFACSSLAPISWWNANDRPAMSPWDSSKPPIPVCKINVLLGRALMAITLDGAINAVRKEHGLRAQRGHFYHLCRGGVVNLGLWSTHFRPPTPGDPPTGVVCGFPWFDRAPAHEDDLAEVRAFMQDGPPPLVFTMGTAAVHVAGKFFEAAVASARALGMRAALIAGKREYFPKDLPTGVRAFTYAPYSMVFPLGAVNIHHGGIGTTAQALRAGKPMLVVPMAHDQFDNAARVRRLTVGLRVRHSKATADTMTPALRKLMEDPVFAQHASALAPKIAAEDGAAAGADALIRAFAGGQEPASQGPKNIRT